MKILPQSRTGILSESRVKQKLESLGLLVHKPVPDIGVDFEVCNPIDKTIIAKIQVKGRNPKLIKTYRWFQLRVQKHEMELARNSGILADETWMMKVRKADFFILDSIYYDEMWVLTQGETFKLIKLNEHQYGLRPDNIFFYEDPLKGKQKEMNLEAKVPGRPIMDEFSNCRNNFSPILKYLRMV